MIYCFRGSVGSPYWYLSGLVLIVASPHGRGAVRVVRVLLFISWWNRFDAVPPLLLVRCRGVRWVDPVRGQLVCLSLAEEGRWWLTRVDEEGCFLAEDLLLLHPFDCLVVEEIPTLAVRRLDIGNVVSFVHRAPFVYHYRLEDVIVSCLLPFGWLALLKVQGRRVRHFAGHFLSFPGY
jgi:hypothetical protein